MSERLHSGFVLLAVGVAFCLAVTGGPVSAAEADKSDQSKPDDEYDRPISIAQSQPPELAAPARARDVLAERGFSFGLKYIGEVFSNQTGGLHRGTIYEAKLRFSLDADLDKAFGLKGLTFHASASQLHGHGIDQYNIGAIMPVSNVEATPTTRLYEMWLQQSMLDDKVNVRLGQLGADQEFMTREWAKIFVNNSLGWPALGLADLPAGGPEFPFSNLAVRIAVRPLDNLTLVAGVFDGDPAGPQGPFDSPDPQVRNPDGVRFRLSDPPFVIAEAQFKYSFEGLSGVAKFGGWRHFGRFADQRFGVDYLSLADPNSVGIPIQRRGDFSIYALVDQQVAKFDGDDDKGAGFFARAMAAPNDRNLVNYYADAGVSFNGLAPGRPHDLFGVAVGYARISNGARALDYDNIAFNNPFAPVRSSEMLLEATYIASVAPGWTLQPDLQYIVRPGGNIPNPMDPTGVKTLRNAFVVGLRTLIRY
jgi:porin